MTDNRVYYPQQPIIPAGRPAQSPPSRRTSKPSAEFHKSFGEVLAQELTGLKFSQHAVERLASRRIELSGADLAKLGSAVDKAARKGARDSLILMNDLALVVSVKNRTVITAMDGDSLKDNVFTNIDSAVII